MNVVNYDLEMQKVVEEIKGQNKKPKLLLHACCAPCATTCIERLKEFFDITVFFFNPNMDAQGEYFLRAEELKRLCVHFNVDFIIEEYNDDLFYSTIKGLEGEKEGGKRCVKCFELRLQKTVETAKDNGYDHFATTLTLSPLKNAKLLNDIGLEVGNRLGVKYLVSDFKKRNGYIRSIELSKELNLYRQNYCGCKFSKARDL